MLSPADDDLLGQVYRNLEEKPIKPDHPFYVEIWENSGHDPVQKLRKHIVWSQVQSLQFFSGFNGSGKSTQLFRLKRDLEQAGYLVIYADASAYLDLADPIEIEVLLLVIAGAFSDNLDTSLLNDSYWSRLTHYLTRTEVDLKEASAKLSAPAPFSEVNIKAELRSSPTFRQRIRKTIQTQLLEIREQVQKFVEDAYEAVQQRNPGQRVVFLFDSFEKLRGTPSNEQEVISSIERLLGSYKEMLQLPYIHCVYSVPAFVRKLLSYSQAVLIPTIKLCEKRVPGTEELPHEPGLRVMRQILEKRFGVTTCHRIFGEPDQAGLFPPAELLIQASGGALRDMLRLFRELLLNAQNLPLTLANAERAIATARNDFQPSVDDARWLAKIHEEQAADLPSTSAADVNRYMRLLDSHFILYFTNDQHWYDIHPLVRDEVARIIAQNPDAAPASE